MSQLNEAASGNAAKTLPPTTTTEDSSSASSTTDHHSMKTNTSPLNTDPSPKQTLECRKPIKPSLKNDVTGKFGQPSHDSSCYTSSEGIGIQMNTKCKCVPQKPLLCSRFLPQVKVAAFRNRLSLGAGERCRTSGLGLHHPLIRDWQHRKRTKAANSLSLLSRHKKLTLSDSSIATQDASPSPLSESCRAGSGSWSIKLPVKENDSSKISTYGREKEYTITTDSTDGSSSGGYADLSTAESRHSDTVCKSDSKHTRILPNIKSSIFTANNDVAVMTDCVILTGEEDHTSCFRKLEKGTHFMQGPPLSSSSFHRQTPRTPSNQLANHSGTHQFAKTEGACSGEFLVSSAGSLTHLSSSSNRRALASVPTLPLIKSQSHTQEYATSSASCLTHKVCDNSNHSQSRRKQSRERCSVVNLRIPFGKVEEWDVPQVQHKQRVQCGVGEAGEGRPGTLEFIVFSDLPKWPGSDSAHNIKQPLPSTSTLIASIMQPHTSPRPSPHHSPPPHCHTSPYSHSHWPHPNPHCHTDPTHRANLISNKHISTVISTRACSSNGQSNIDKHSNSTSPTTHASTHKPSVNTCTAFSTGSGTSLHAPSISATSFVSQSLPHSLRYRHPNSRRGFVHSRVDSTDENCNHSMCITSYPTNGNHRNRRIFSSDSGRLGGLETHSVDPSSAGSHTTSVVSYEATPHPQASIRHSRVGQLMGQTATAAGVGGRSGRVVECGHCRRNVRKKHSNSNSNSFAYPDPITGCSSRFHHRLLRLAALVADTLTHEQSRKKQKHSRSHSTYKDLCVLASMS